MMTDVLSMFIQRMQKTPLQTAIKRIIPPSMRPKPTVSRPPPPPPLAGGGGRGGGIFSESIRKEIERQRIEEARRIAKERIKKIESEYLKELGKTREQLSDLEKTRLEQIKKGKSVTVFSAKTGKEKILLEGKPLEYGIIARQKLSAEELGKDIEKLRAFGKELEAEAKKAEALRAKAEKTLSRRDIEQYNAVAKALQKKISSYNAAVEKMQRQQEIRQKREFKKEIEFYKREGAFEGLKTALGKEPETLAELRQAEEKMTALAKAREKFPSVTAAGKKIREPEYLAEQFFRAKQLEEAGGAMVIPQREKTLVEAGAEAVSEAPVETGKAMVGLPLGLLGMKRPETVREKLVEKKAGLEKEIKNLGEERQSLLEKRMANKLTEKEIEDFEEKVEKVKEKVEDLNKEFEEYSPSLDVARLGYEAAGLSLIFAPAGAISGLAGLGVETAGTIAGTVTGAVGEEVERRYAPVSGLTGLPKEVTVPVAGLAGFFAGAAKTSKFLTRALARKPIKATGFREMGIVSLEEEEKVLSKFLGKTELELRHPLLRGKVEKIGVAEIGKLETIKLPPTARISAFVEGKLPFGAQEGFAKQLEKAGERLETAKGVRKEIPLASKMKMLIEGEGKGKKITVFKPEEAPALAKEMPPTISRGIRYSLGGRIKKAIPFEKIFKGKPGFPKKVLELQEKRGSAFLMGAEPSVAKRATLLEVEGKPLVEYAGEKGGVSILDISQIKRPAKIRALKEIEVKKVPGFAGGKFTQEMAFKRLKKGFFGAAKAETKHIVVEGEKVLAELALDTEAKILGLLGKAKKVSKAKALKKAKVRKPSIRTKPYTREELLRMKSIFLEKPKPRGLADMPRIERLAMIRDPLQVLKEEQLLAEAAGEHKIVRIFEKKIKALKKRRLEFKQADELIRTKPYTREELLRMKSIYEPKKIKFKEKKRFRRDLSGKVSFIEPEIPKGAKLIKTKEGQIQILKTKTLQKTVLREKKALESAVTGQRVSAGLEKKALQEIGEKILKAHKRVKAVERAMLKKAVPVSIAKTGVKAFSAQLKAAKQISATKLKPVSLQKYSEVQALKSIEALKPIEALKSVEALKQAEALKQVEALKQIEALKPVEALKVKTITIGSTPRPLPPPPPPIQPTPTLLGILQGRKRFLRPEKKKQVEGYNVFVKKGKRISQLNIIPLDKPAAVKQGIQATDTTPARTFIIEKANTKVKPSGTRMPSLKKYRRPKGKSRLPRQAFVEKSKYAIDSPFEKQKITFAGLKALKTKPKKNKIIGGLIMAKKRRKKRKTKRRKKRRR